MSGYEPEDKTLISPVTTPGSVESASFTVVNYYIPQQKKDEKWYQRLHPPYMVITISLIEILFYYTANDNVQNALRFDPINQQELWRFVSYMLLHDSWQHLALNVLLQCLFATYLESKERGWKILCVYVGGGIGGALGAGCIRPDLLVGASAGVYAILISYISYFILNFKTMKYRLWKGLSIVIIIISDAIYNVVHMYRYDTPTISWGAHIFGALVGFLTGLLLYSNKYDSKYARIVLTYIPIVCLVLLIATLVLLDLHIQKCSVSSKPVKYSYVC